jgi:hypothetical protein
MHFQNSIFKKVLLKSQKNQEYEYSIAYEQRLINGIKTNQFFPKFSNSDQNSIKFNFKDRFYDLRLDERVANTRRLLKPMDSKLMNSDQVHEALKYSNC